MNNCIKWLLLLQFLSQLKIKTEAMNKRMLDKWDYSCNQNLAYQKTFASGKLGNKIETKYKPLQNGLSI